MQAFAMQAKIENNMSRNNTHLPKGLFNFRCLCSKCFTLDYYRKKKEKEKVNQAYLVQVAKLKFGKWKNQDKYIVF